MKTLAPLVLALALTASYSKSSTAQDWTPIGFKAGTAQPISASEFYELQKALQIGPAQFNVVRIVSENQAELGLVREDGIYYRTMKTTATFNKSGTITLNLEKAGSLTLDLKNNSMKAGTMEVSISKMKVYESPLKLSPAVMGFSRRPEVYLLQKEVTLIGRPFNTIRLVSEADNSYTLRFGKAISQSETDHFLNEQTAVTVKNVKFDPKNPRMIKLGKNTTLELMDDHILINKSRVDAQAYRSYRNDNGYVLTSSSKEMSADEIKFLKVAGFRKVTFANTLKSFNILNTLRSFLPENNPYAVLKGYDCRELKKVENRIRCQEDSPLNPFNKIVNCKEVLEFWEINKGENVCAAKVRGYSFRVEKKIGYDYLKGQGFMSKIGSSEMEYDSLEDRKSILKDELGTDLIETIEAVLPEGNDFI